MAIGRERPPLPEASRPKDGPGEEKGEEEKRAAAGRGGRGAAALGDFMTQPSMEGSKVAMPLVGGGAQTQREGGRLEILVDFTCPEREGLEERGRCKGGGSPLAGWDISRVVRTSCPTAPPATVSLSPSPPLSLPSLQTEMGSVDPIGRWAVRGGAWPGAEWREA